MKKLNAFLASVFATAALNAAVIEQVIVRQQWPWSTDVKIEYKLSGVALPVDISVRAYNGDVELDQEKVLSALTGDRYGIAEDGVGMLVLDPVKAFGTEKVALANFKVKLAVADSPADIDEVIYKIFNLKDGSCQDVSRATILNGRMGSFTTDFGTIGDGYKTGLTNVLIWTGVTENDLYKTNCIVMRKINAKGVKWMMGSAANEYLHQGREGLHPVIMTNDYWISVFPVTVAQHELIGTKHTWNGVYHDSCTNKCPVATYRDYARGDNNGGLDFPKDKHKVKDGTFLDALRKKTGVDFEYPTSAQWEYACRAGTTSMLYTGATPTTQAEMQKVLDKLCWYDRTSGDTLGGKTGRGYHEVGTLPPNAFGLYDMYGNIAEFCLDKYCENAATDEIAYEPEGPEGTSSADSRVIRTFSYASSFQNFRSAQFGNSVSSGLTGIRLMLPESLVYPADQK